MINIINHLQKAVSGEALLAPGWDWIWGCSSREQCVYLMLMFSQVRRIQWGHIWETAALLLGLWGRRWAWNLLHTSLSAFPTHHTEITNLHVWMFKWSCLCFLLCACAIIFFHIFKLCSSLCEKSTFSSKTGVSMVSAPWRLKQPVMMLKTFSLMAICLGL